MTSKMNNNIRESSKGDVVIYKTENGETYLDVHLQEDTVWLNLNQLVELFDRDKSVISRHIRNIYKNSELDQNATVAKFATVQMEAQRRISRQIQYYNLDLIISLGYRVNSIRGTQFRIWANKILKDYLVQGYALNEKRLLNKIEQLDTIKDSIRIIVKTAEQLRLSKGEYDSLLHVLSDYSYALDILDKYDYSELEIEKTTDEEHFRINIDDARKAIDLMRTRVKDSNLFGREKDRSLASSINNIYQTFGGKQLYPSIEEKSAHLLYFIVKNHSFVDGNKRIAASLFLWFLEKNDILYKADGSRLLTDNALVALTLMIAVSDPKDKETLIKVVVNLINRAN